MKCLFSKFSCSNADLHTISVNCLSRSSIFAAGPDRHDALILSASYYISVSNLSFFAANMVFFHSQVANMKIAAFSLSLCI